MLLINNSAVEEVLDARSCLDALESVFRELAVGEAVGLGRMDRYVPSGEERAPYYRWAVMAGGSRKDGYVCARMLSDMVAWPRELRGRRAGPLPDRRRGDASGPATPHLERYPDEAFSARAGYLAYVDGTPEEPAMVPRVDLPADFLDMPRLSDLVAGRTEGRTSPEQTTFLNDVGAIGAQFEAVAAAVYERARAEGVGREIPTEWFLQDVRD